MSYVCGHVHWQWSVLILILIYSTSLVASKESREETQEDAATIRDNSRLSLRVAMESFANLSGATEGGGGGGNLWLVVPSNTSLSQIQLNDGEFSLFKLNTDVLRGDMDQAPTEDGFGRDSEDQANGNWPASGGGHREGRKMNLFKNPFNKPKVSPLYLINGTVCRFVNTQPICTTLSTTGLIRPNQMGGNQGGGFFGNNQQQQQQQQQQNNNNNNNFQRANQQGNSGPFGQQNQPFRPAAVMDDETADLSVGSASQQANVTANSTGGLQATATGRPTDIATVGGSNINSNNNRPQPQQYPVVRPLNMVVSRHPLNLLAFGRPFRQRQSGLRRSFDSQANGGGHASS